MKEELVSSQVATLAKEKGFDIEEPCTCGGYPDCICEQVRKNDHVYIPTQSLLQRWLREDHNIDITVMIMGSSQYEYYIHQKRILKHNNNVIPESPEDVKHLYEKTLELALQKALKLIK